MNFDQSVAVVLRLEGGKKITDDPNDSGGLTRYGISLAAHPELGPAGIRNLTEEKARAIYREEYWDSMKIDQFPPYLRLAFFDGAVNQGKDGSVHILQKSLTALGSEIEQDGILGTKTMAALQKSERPGVCCRVSLSEDRCLYQDEKVQNIWQGLDQTHHPPCPGHEVNRP